MDTTLFVYEIWVLGCGFLMGVIAGILIWGIKALLDIKLDFAMTASLIAGVLYGSILKLSMGYSFSELLKYEQADFSAGIILGIFAFASLYWLTNLQGSPFINQLLAVNGTKTSKYSEYQRLNTKSLRLLASLQKVPYYSRYSKSKLIEILEAQ